MVAVAIARKDLMSEWRTRELVPALAQFVVLALVIANFGFQIDSHNASAIAPGVLWLALVFAGLIAFGRAFAAEREQVPVVLWSPRCKGGPVGVRQTFADIGMTVAAHLDVPPTRAGKVI